MIQLSDIVMQAEHSQPDSFVIVTGNFNKANLKKEMPTFIHQVTCATRDDRTLHHCHTTIKGTQCSIPCAPIGRSDHDLPCADLQTTTDVCEPIHENFDTVVSERVGDTLWLF